jgi:hypothetical protein
MVLPENQELGAMPNRALIILHQEMPKGIFLWRTEWLLLELQGLVLIWGNDRSFILLLF